MFSRDLRLDAAPGISVTRNYDLVFYGDAQPIELLIVARQTVVYVDQVGGYVAVDRVSVVGRQLLTLLVGSWIASHRRLLQLGNVFCRRHKQIGRASCR